MDKVGGPLGVVAIAAVAFLLIGLAVLHFGFHVFRRRKGKTRAKSGVMSDARVEVLETTVIDADRRLVLIRCDRIEHLIMIGGPADLVVENDVRKLRGHAAPAAMPGLESEKRAAPTPAVEEKRTAAPPRPAHPGAVLPEPPLAPVPKAEPQRTAPRPAAETRPAPAAPRMLPTGNRPGTPPQAKVEEPARAAPQRPLAADAKSNRRDIVPARRPPLMASPSPRPPLTAAPNARPAEPLRAPPPAAANDRAAMPTRANGRTDPGPGLPAAQIPWSDTDSIENEIVRALRFDAQPLGDTPARREPPSAKALTDSSTTLGDLADRLEEALAREVQSASQSRPAAAEPSDFSFESEPSAPPAVVEPPKPKAVQAPPQKARPEKRERPEPPRAAAKPATEGEAPAEPTAERREEAPVISLNSRRRESADPLEDEMARLLGELTGDSKGR